MSGSEQLFISGSDPLRVEFVNPNGTAAALRGRGAIDVDPVLGQVALFVPRDTFAEFEQRRALDIVVDSRLNLPFIAAGAGQASIVGYS